MGFLKRLFLPKKKFPPADLSRLGTDIHSHFIPGIDDGARSMEESLQLISAMHAFGYKKVITTPHIMSDYYRNTPEIILQGLEKVREALKEAQISIQIEAAAEYYVDYDFEQNIQHGTLLTFGNNYVLIELPFLNAPENLNKVIFDLQTTGYRPVLAHPERYTYWFRDFNKYIDLKDKGVLFQLNINCLSGHYSIPIKRISERMIDENMIELLGSDCHNINHINLLEHTRREKYLHKILESPGLLNPSL